VRGDRLKRSLQLGSSTRLNWNMSSFFLPFSFSKHILNAQVSIRAPCCRQFFDCPQCHYEKAGDHELMKSTEMTFVCKKCKKAFRKQLETFEDEDEYCPHCDNHYVSASVCIDLREGGRRERRRASRYDLLGKMRSGPAARGDDDGYKGMLTLSSPTQVVDAKTPAPMIGVEGEDARMDNR
jgi:uncharacterized CHY-type Zn-finger protein